MTCQIRNTADCIHVAQHVFTINWGFNEEILWPQNVTRFRELRSVPYSKYNKPQGSRAIDKRRIRSIHITHRVKFRSTYKQTRKRSTSTAHSYVLHLSILHALRNPAIEMSSFCSLRRPRFTMSIASVLVFPRKPAASVSLISPIRVLENALMVTFHQALLSVFAFKLLKLHRRVSGPALRSLLSFFSSASGFASKSFGISSLKTHFSFSHGPCRS